MILYASGEAEKIWFTSDHHFGHANIIRYCCRPFPFVTDMDDALIEMWNSVVGHDDAVFHLGDFTLLSYNPFREYVSRLNGRITIIPGGHDYKWLEAWWLGLDSDIVSKSGHKVEVVEPLISIEIQGESGERPDVVVACHYAMRVWDRSHYGSIHLYGHSHGALQGLGRSMDVGVDAHDYYPISFAKIKAELGDAA